MDCIQVSDEVFAVLSDGFIVGEWMLWIDFGGVLIIVQNWNEEKYQKTLQSVVLYLICLFHLQYLYRYLYRYFA